jgi:hypothetical protein
VLAKCAPSVANSEDGDCDSSPPRTKSRRAVTAVLYCIVVCRPFCCAIQFCCCCWALQLLQLNARKCASHAPSHVEPFGRGGRRLDGTDWLLAVDLIWFRCHTYGPVRRSDHRRGIEQSGFYSFQFSDCDDRRLRRRREAERLR